MCAPVVLTPSDALCTAWAEGQDYAFGGDDKKRALIRGLRDCTWDECNLSKGDEEPVQCPGIEGKGCPTCQYTHVSCFRTGWRQHFEVLVGLCDYAGIYCIQCCDLIGTLRF